MTRRSDTHRRNSGSAAFAVTTILAALVALGATTTLIGCSKDSTPPVFEPIETQEGDDDDEGSQASGNAPIDDGSGANAQEAHTPTGPSTYVVQAGDNLGRIASIYDCSVEDVRRANNIRGDLIHPGDSLTIPACGEDAPEVEVPALEPGTAYTIVSGDILEEIAERAGCTTSQLMLANDLSNDNIYAGRTLNLPDCSVEVLPPIGDAPPEASGADPRNDPDDEETDEQEVDEDEEVDVDEDGGPHQTGDRSDLEDGELYNVSPGDFLGAIARRYGCSVSEVQSANNLSSDMIRVGQTLRIPEECTGEAIDVVTVSRVRTGGRDTETLPRLMEERGFDPPRRFRGLVLAIDFNSSRSQVVNEQLFDYDGTADDTDWNPASTVKLFAAIAAMRTIEELGFTGGATLTFDGDESYTVDELVQEALGPSNNIAYNFLVTFVGYDAINGEFFSGSNGFADTALRRPYERSTWMDLGYSSSFRASPEIVITEGGRSHTIAAREGDLDVDCSSSACTSLADLAEVMRRLMLQEQIPRSEHFGLARDDLLTIRGTLRSLGRSRGEEVVDALRDSFPGDGVNLYHKAGFSNDWYSDTVYIYDPIRYPTQAWIVALAGNPGRDSLTEAAELIGELIAEGHL